MPPPTSPGVEGVRGGGRESGVWVVGVGGKKIKIKICCGHLGYGESSTLQFPCAVAQTQRDVAEVAEEAAAAALALRHGWTGDGEEAARRRCPPPTAAC